jgi:hypothetical protein
MRRTEAPYGDVERRREVPGDHHGRDLATHERQELRVFLEPKEKNDLLWSSVERYDFTPLEEKAADLRSVLL